MALKHMQSTWHNYGYIARRKAYKLLSRQYIVSLSSCSAEKKWKLAGLLLEKGADLNKGEHDTQDITQLPYKVFKESSDKE